MSCHVSFSNQATIKTLLETGYQHLSSQTDVQYLLSYVLKKDRSFLYRWPSYVVETPVSQAFHALIIKRKQGWPIAYLTQKQPFWSLDLTINSSTLIPRPETEHLVEVALSKIDTGQICQIVDLGTGSGAVGLALAIERPESEIFATDISEAALDVARYNADQLATQNVRFYAGDWYQALPKGQQYDLIVSNPPYIAQDERHLLSKEVYFEPLIALFSEEGGLKDIRRIIKEAPYYLKKGGWLLLEHGFLQAEKVRCLLKQRGLQSIFTQKDYAGHERVTGGQL